MQALPAAAADRRRKPTADTPSGCCVADVKRQAARQEGLRLLMICWSLHAHLDREPLARRGMSERTLAVRKSMTLDRSTAARLVAVVCAAQVLVQIGAFFWPALLPQMMPLWGLTNSEAGWITAVFYAAYMLSVPVLVTLTDRIDAKRVYLFGVGCTIAGHLLFGLFADGFWSALASRALAGIGWAGTYMTGLKLLADQVDAKMMSRAVTGHAASIGISGALSFCCGDLLADAFGWRAAFARRRRSRAAVAWVHRRAGRARAAQPPATACRPAAALFDFRPVLRNRSAMAYALAYCIHTLEMNALRGWGVAFLAYVAASTRQRRGALSRRRSSSRRSA